MPFKEVEDMDTNFNRDEFFCQTCQLSFFSELNFKEHNLSVMHHTKYEECLSTGGSTNMLKHFCFLCMKTMSMGNWLSHIKGKKHCFLVNDMRKKLGKSQSRDNDSNFSERSRSASVSSQSSSTSSMRSGLSSNRSHDFAHPLQNNSNLNHDSHHVATEKQFQRPDSGTQSYANQNAINRYGIYGSSNSRQSSFSNQADSVVTSAGRPPPRLSQADSVVTSAGRPPSRQSQADSVSTSAGRPPSRQSQADSVSTSAGRPSSRQSQADSVSTSAGRPPSRLSQADSVSTSAGRPPSRFSLPDNYISSTTSKFDGPNLNSTALHVNRSSSYLTSLNDRMGDRTDILLEKTRHLMDTFRAQRQQHSHYRQQTQTQIHQQYKEMFQGYRVGDVDVNLDNGKQHSCASTEQVRRNLEASTRARASTDLLHLVNAGPRGRRERQQLQGMLKAAAARQSRPVLPEEPADMIDATAEDLHERNILQSLERDIHTILLRERQEEENSYSSFTVTPLSATARTVDSEDVEAEETLRSVDDCVIWDNQNHRYDLMAPSQKDLAPVVDSPDMLDDSSSSMTGSSFSMPVSKKPRVLSPPRHTQHSSTKVKIEALQRAFLSKAGKSHVHGSMPATTSRRQSQNSASSVCSDSSTATSTIVDTGVAYDFTEFRAPLRPFSSANPFSLSAASSSTTSTADNTQQPQGMALPLLSPSIACSIAVMDNVHSPPTKRTSSHIKKEQNVEIVDARCSSKSSSRSSSVVSDVSSATAQDISLMHQALELSLKEEEVRVKIEAVDERIRALQTVIDETLKKMDFEEELKMGLRIEERDLRDRRMNILRECYTRPRLDELTLELEQTVNEPDSSAALVESGADLLENAAVRGAVAATDVDNSAVESGAQMDGLGDNTVRNIIQRVICTDMVDERSWDELEDVVKDMQERDEGKNQELHQQRPISDDHIVSDQLSPKLNSNSKQKCRSLQSVSPSGAGSSSDSLPRLSTPTTLTGGSMIRASSETQLKQNQSSRPPRKARRQDPITSMRLKEYLHASSSSDVDLDESDTAATAKNRAKLQKIDMCYNSQKSKSRIDLASISNYCPGFLQAHCDGPVLDLSVYGDSLFTCSTDGTVKRFNLEHRTPLRVYEGHTALVHCLLVSELDDKTTVIVSGGFDRQLLSHDIDSGQLKLALTLNAKIHCLTKSLNLIMVGLGNGYIVTVDIDRNCAINSWPSTSSAAISCITVDMDWSKRRVVLVGSHEPSVAVHDALSGEVLRKLFSHCGEPLALICWPSQSILSLAGGLIRIHDYNTGKVKQETLVGDQASCLIRGNDGKVLVGGIDGTIRVFNWDRSSESVCQVYYTPASAAIIALCVVPNAGLIIVGDRTGAIHVLHEVPLKQALRCQVATCSAALCSRDDLVYHVTRQHVLSCSESDAPICRWANCQHRFPRLCNAEDVHIHMKECHLD